MSIMLAGPTSREQDLEVEVRDLKRVIRQMTNNVRGFHEWLRTHGHAEAMRALETMCQETR